MNSENDVHDPKFESKMDSFFTSKEKEAKGESYRRWDKDAARSALVRRGWSQGIIGVKSPVAK